MMGGMKAKPKKRSLARKLRYLDVRNVLADYPAKRERAAISAVLEWLSYALVCAWKEGDLFDPNLTPSVRGGGAKLRAHLEKPDAYLLMGEAVAQFDRLEAAVAPSAKKRRKVA